MKISVLKQGSLLWVITTFVLDPFPYSNQFLNAKAAVDNVLPSRWFSQYQCARWECRISEQVVTNRLAMEVNFGDWARYVGLLQDGDDRVAPRRSPHQMTMRPTRQCCKVVRSSFSSVPQEWTWYTFRTAHISRAQHSTAADYLFVWTKAVAGGCRPSEHLVSLRVPQRLCHPQLQSFFMIFSRSIDLPYIANDALMNRLKIMSVGSETIWIVVWFFLYNWGKGSQVWHYIWNRRAWGNWPLMFPYFPHREGDFLQRKQSTRHVSSKIFFANE